MSCQKKETSPTQSAGKDREIKSEASKDHWSANDSPPSDRLAATTPAPAQYHLQPITGSRELMQLKSRIGDERFSIVLKVNRLDIKHVRQGEALVVPDGLSDFLTLSPFPRELDVGRSQPKLLLVSLRVQAFAGYESGKLIRWGPTSTGKKATPTPVGLYYTNWKAKEHASTFNDEWVLRWYFNLDNYEGISFHQYDLPGYPASHACVRLLEEDAFWIYHWAEQWTVSEDGRSILITGTPVIVFGEYRFGQRPPWKRLTEDPEATTLTKHEVKEALEHYLPPTKQ